MGNRGVDLGTLCDFVARLFGVSLSPFLTKHIFVSDPIFSKALPTEPRLTNKKPLVLNSELGSVEKELSTDLPPTTQLPYPVPTPSLCMQENQKCVQTPQIRGRGTSPRDNHHHQEWGPSSTSPSTRAKLPKAGLTPQLQQRQRGTDFHLLYPGSWI